MGGTALNGDWVTLRMNNQKEINTPAHRVDVVFGNSFRCRLGALKMHRGLSGLGNMGCDVPAFEHPVHGLLMQQNRYAPMILDCLIMSHRPETIIEIGTRTGGLSVLMGMWAHLNNAELITIDTSEEQLEYKPLMDFLGVNFIEADIFNKKTIKMLKKRIKEPKKCMILCDADKAREFDIYSDFMKVNDVILAHDYAHDESDFENIRQQGIWSHDELEYKDIKEACERNNLRYIDHNLFRLAAWGAFIKK